METTLHWKKGFFKTCADLLSGESIVGKTKSNGWNQSGEGVLNSKQYFFKTTGFFSQATEIQDLVTGEMVGNITYNAWSTKATLELHGKTYQWKYQNVWQTKWILEGENVEVRYAGYDHKGTVVSNTSDELIMLSGLYVTNYFAQMAMAIAVFVPAWITLFM